jgi:lipopolysaccharide transport system permease protein
MEDIEYEIGPPKKIGLGLGELWEHRELLYFFTWRDIKVKYKQTLLGFLWAVLQPLLLTLIFSFSLGKLLSSNWHEELNYPVYVLSGLVLWGIFSSGVSGAGNSMVTNANIIKKIYFPRLIIPISAVLVSLFDFFMALPVFVGVLLYYHTWFHLTAFAYIPLAIFLTCLSTFGIGTWLSALNIKYRDFRYVIPFLIQALLFLSAVLYPIGQTNVVLFKYLLALNPMSAALDLFRMSISGNIPDTTFFLLSAASACICFFTGLYYFRKTEYYFADLA